MNVVVYTRSALPNTIEDEWQREACLRLAAELGYEVSRTYSDDGRDRPAMQELMADVTGGVIDVLLLARYDRLTRSSTENHRITAALLDANVQVYAANIGPRPLDDPSIFTTQIMATMRASHPTTGRYAVNSARRPRGRS